MMKKTTNTGSTCMRLLYIGIFLSCSSLTWAQDSHINMVCKMDNGVDLRLTIDLDKKQMWNTWLLERQPDMEKFRIIKISDSEINAEFRPFAESKVDAEQSFYFTWSIDRYTLKISEYAPLGFGRTNNWRKGQCEVLKKQL